MPVIVLAEGAGPGGHLTIVPITDISTDGNHSHHSVKGRVVHKGPLVSSPSHDFILKAVIEEEKSGPKEASSINLVLLGMLASDFCQAVNQGDVVTASGFAVGKSPTAQKDKRHSCNLLLSGEQAFVRVSRRPPGQLASPQQAKKKKTPPPTAVRSTSSCRIVDPRRADFLVIVPVLSAPRAGSRRAAVHVRQAGGAETRSRGQRVRRGGLLQTALQEPRLRPLLLPEDQRSVGAKGQLQHLLRQTGEAPANLPDRRHRALTQSQGYVRPGRNRKAAVITTYGFSALAFSGTVGAEVEPRGSGPTRRLSEEDRRIVTELRSWAAGRDLLPPDPTVSLARVQPRMYFNLACQLLAKAPVDSRCTLLRVWDGTRCPHALLNVTVDSDVVEGPPSFAEEQEKLIVNVLVYDDHAQSAQQLKPGDFVKIFNLRAIVGSVKIPGRSGGRAEEVDRLSFHLHGGTAYSRGVRRLPDDSPDLRELRRVMRVFRESNEGTQAELHDSAMWEIWNTPPKSPGGGASVEFSTGMKHNRAAVDRRCQHDVRPVTLGELTRGEPAGVHHVRAQLRSYEPRRLHRALKLYCSKCTSMQDVPDDKRLASVFAEGYGVDLGAPSARPPPWSRSGRVYLPGYDPVEGPPARVLGVHLSERLMSQGRTKELIFLTGSTLEEARHLAGTYRNVVPVHSAPGCHPTLLDLSAPFLFRGKRRFYGCKRCSEGAAIREPTTGRDQIIDEKIIAEAFGVQLLKFVLLLKFRLQDASDALDVFLWRDAESFFDVSADDAATNQEAQDQIQRTMDSLCPPKGAGGERPWLDLCLAAYRATDVESRQTFYQICHTSVKNALTQKDTSP
uniref:Protection of telomeres 1 homolog n=1 Tax=Hippocampus comes TaxID=109280 RepID=A0A3Q2XUF9_HIPCM